MKPVDSLKRGLELRFLTNQANGDYYYLIDFTSIFGYNGIM